MVPDLYTDFQEAGQVVWYSHLFQSFPQFIVIHTVKGFGTTSTTLDKLKEVKDLYNENYKMLLK